LIPGGAGWSASASGSVGSLPADGKLFPSNVEVVSSSGVVLSHGSSKDGVPVNFTVDSPQWGFDPTRPNFYAYTVLAPRSLSARCSARAAEHSPPTDHPNTRLATLL
jgi:hypothetical protein